MATFREAIMEHIKNKQSLNKTQISSIEDRLTQLATQFHTPDHPPYAAMIQRALLELKQRGGSTQKSISEFIKREYDDLPWAHSSLLKHHLGLLSKNGEIIATRGFRYSLCGAGSSSDSMKGGKKHHKKKWRCNYDRTRPKRLKLVGVVRSPKENEFEVTEDPSQVNDQSSQVAGNPVIETEKLPNDELQSLKQDGKLPQLPGREGNDVCSRSNDKNIDSPLLAETDGRDYQVGIELQQEDCQLKIHERYDLHPLDMHGRNPNEDATHEHLSPEMPPGFEVMGVEVSESQECSLVNSLPLRATEANLPAEPTISPLPSVNKKQQRNALPVPIAEKLQKDDLPRQGQLQQMNEKKERRHPEGREYGKELEQRVYVLALPHAQKGFSLSRDLPVQNKHSQVEITTDVGKSLVLKKLPSESTMITRRKARLSNLSRQRGAQSQPISVPLCSYKDLRQDEGCNSHGVRHSTRLLALPQLDEDIPLRKYQRRRRGAAKTEATEIISL